MTDLNIPDELMALVPYFEGHGWKYDRVRAAIDGNARPWFYRGKGAALYFDIIDGELYVWRVEHGIKVLFTHKLCDPKCFEKLEKLELIL